jgi:tetratricopeptide (TPR) repeat protein
VLLCAGVIAVCGPAFGDEEAEARTGIAGYAELARKAADQGKWPLVDHFLGLLAGVDAPLSEKKNALRELAEDYEKRQIHARAIAVYEKMVKIYPDDPGTPELMFRLGVLYRESGVPKLAIARFYMVLNSTLKFGGDDLPAYRSLAQRAQWEIAETFFKTNDIPNAKKYYELLSRVDMPPAEKARVRFKLTHCLFVLDDVPGAITSAQFFLKDFPDDPSAAECRYLLASAFRSQNRKTEAFDAILGLLRAETGKKEKDPEKWIYWKKKAGNEFANSYYQQGDALSALTIYQAIARLSDEPEWQWPVLYQMGLCFERLRYGDRAADAYKFLLDEAKKPGREADKLPDILRTVLDMARWRASHLAWSNNAAVNLQKLLSSPLAKAAPPTLKP